MGVRPAEAVRRHHHQARIIDGAKAIARERGADHLTAQRFTHGPGVDLLRGAVGQRNHPNRDRPAVAELHRDLGLGVGRELGDPAFAPGTVDALGQTVRSRERIGHLFR